MAKNYILYSHYKESERKFTSSVVEEDEKDARIEEHLKYGLVSEAIPTEEYFKECPDIRAKIEKVLSCVDSVENWDIEGNILMVEVSWGDWKHDHLFLDFLMNRLFNFSVISTDVTEEDGGDCYSAIHYYKVEEVVA